jgi:hypothetical protein
MIRIIFTNFLPFQENKFDTQLLNNFRGFFISHLTFDPEINSGQAFYVFNLSLAHLLSKFVCDLQQ